MSENTAGSKNHIESTSVSAVYIPLRHTIPIKDTDITMGEKCSLVGSTLYFAEATSTNTNSRALGAIMTYGVFLKRDLFST